MGAERHSQRAACPNSGQRIGALANLAQALMLRHRVDIAAIARVNVTENVEKYQIQNGLGPPQMRDAV